MDVLHCLNFNQRILLKLLAFIYADESDGHNKNMFNVH
jgi:hypothetical protein